MGKGRGKLRHHTDRHLESVDSLSRASVAQTQESVGKERSASEDPHTWSLKFKGLTANGPI